MKADAGGNFPSDEHRRVLGHLSHPDDDYGWTHEALVYRIHPPVPDAGLPTVLDELQQFGWAEEIGGAFRMTQEGFDLLTGEIAGQPEELQPAGISPHPMHAAAATKIEVETT